MAKAVVIEVSVPESFSALGDTAVGELVVELQRVRNQLDAVEALVLAEFSRRAVWAADGARSVASWVEQRTNASRRRVAAALKVGRGLEGAWRLREAARSGAVPIESVRHVLRCAAYPEPFAESEELLVDQSLVLRPADLGVAIASWIAHVDPDGPELPGERPGEMFLARTFDGRWEFSGSLPADDGAVLAAKLDELVDRWLKARRDGDPSIGDVPVSVLRSRALVELAAQAMRREQGDASTPDRYRVGVIVHAADLTNSVETCDASFYRVIVGADSEVLDLGRETRRWSRAQRRAITYRDGGCAFPGCAMRPSACEIHHIHDWHYGGETNRDNGVLLCRLHHSFIHRQRWVIVIASPGARPQFRRPDGMRFMVEARNQKWYTQRRTGQGGTEPATRDRARCAPATMAALSSVGSVEASTK